MNKFLYFLMVLIFTLFACSGEDAISSDSTPPQKPHLIPHLGDTGDIVVGDTLNYYDNNGFESNGIDAISEADWIQIQWEHLIDEDIDYVEIHRFSLEDYHDYIENIEQYGEDYEYDTMIHQMPYLEQDYYIDDSSSLVGFNWFYFIKAFDTSGNSTKSDTVCYRLINKPVLIFPGSGTYDLEELNFEWQPGTWISTRLLLFDENYNLLWHYSPLDDPTGTNVVYDGPLDLEPQVVRWRIDAFEDEMIYSIEGKQYEMHSGSESFELVFYIQ